MLSIYRLSYNLANKTVYSCLANFSCYIKKPLFSLSTHGFGAARLNTFSSFNQNNQIDRLAKIETINTSYLNKKPHRKAGSNQVIKQESSLVTAYSTANEYNLEELSDVMLQNSYIETVIAEDVEEDVLLFKNPNKESSLIYIFREGSIVFWDIEMNEAKNILNIIKPFEFRPYNESVVNEEMDQIDFQLTDGKSRIQKSVFYVNRNEGSLAHYTFSNALSLSVKLSIWEASLEQYIESIKFVPKDIKDGRKIRLTRDQVFQKTGELFDLRHHINLSSDLLDTPDFYWDRQDLESLFLQACSSLNISKRTKIINEKLNHCSKLMMLVGHHLDDKHHFRLEWMIVILIMVEVVFEVIHYLEKAK